MVHSGNGFDRGGSTGRAEMPPTRTPSMPRTTQTDGDHTILPVISWVRVRHTFALRMSVRFILKKCLQYFNEKFGNLIRPPG